MTTSNTKTLVMEVLKWVFAALIVAFIYFMLNAGGKQSQADFSQVSASVTGAAELSDTIEGNNQMVKRLYGLDPAEYAGVTLYYPSTNMGAEELLLVKLSDMSQQAAVKSAMESRVQSQMDVFEGYAPTQYATLEKSVIEVQGNYLLLIVADDPAPVREAFLNAL